MAIPNLSKYRISRASPLPVPDRRYRIAKTCRAYGVLPCFRRDDEETWTIWRFLMDLEAASDAAQRAKVIEKYSDLAVAFRLHHGKLKHLGPLVQSYLLAGMDNKSIAKRVAVLSKAIKWFRLAFYDVAVARKFPQYVVLDLIGRVDDEGHVTLDTHSLWKSIGYTLGPEALDRVFYNPDADKAAYKVGGLAAWFSEKTQDVIRSKQLMAASSLDPHDQKQAATLLKLLLQGPANRVSPMSSPAIRSNRRLKPC